MVKCLIQVVYNENINFSVLKVYLTSKLSIVNENDFCTGKKTPFLAKGKVLSENQTQGQSQSVKLRLLAIRSLPANVFILIALSLQVYLCQLCMFGIYSTSSCLLNIFVLGSNFQISTHLPSSTDLKACLLNQEDHDYKFLQIQTNLVLWCIY